MFKFLLVFHCNYGHILCRFGDKARYYSQIAIVHTLFYITTQPPGGNGYDYFHAVFSQPI